jgi:hypothetical protein
MSENPQGNKVPLSAEDKAILQNAWSHHAKYYSIALKCLPFSLTATSLLFYIEGNALTGISALITLAVLVAIPVFYWPMSRLMRDLRNNYKVISQYTVTKKFISGYVKPAGESGRKYRSTSIQLDDGTMNELVRYQQLRQSSDSMSQFMNQSDTLDRFLTYDYNLMLKSASGTKTFPVPIEDFMIAEVGKRIEVAYAERSAKVFNARPILY